MSVVSLLRLLVSTVVLHARKSLPCLPSFPAHARFVPIWGCLHASCPLVVFDGELEPHAGVVGPVGGVDYGFGFDHVLGCVVFD